MSRSPYEAGMRSCLTHAIHPSICPDTDQVPGTSRHQGFSSKTNGLHPILNGDVYSSDGGQTDNKQAN